MDGIECPDAGFSRITRARIAVFKIRDSTETVSRTDFGLRPASSIELAHSSTSIQSIELILRPENRGRRWTRSIRSYPRRVDGASLTVVLHHVAAHWSKRLLSARGAEPAAGLNGPSWDWVAANILARLGFDQSQAWITDCLDTYRASTGMTNVVESVYAPFAAGRGLVLRPSWQCTRPRGRSSRRQWPSTCHACVVNLIALVRRVIVTLGNAALRVLAALMDDTPSLAKVSVDRYGEPRGIAISGFESMWHPLAHPQRATRRLTGAGSHNASDRRG